MNPRTYKPAILLAFALSSPFIYAAPKITAPAVVLTEAGKALETKYADMQKALQQEIEAALPKRDDAKVTAWLSAIKAEEATSKDAAAKAGAIKKLQSAAAKLKQLQEDTKKPLVTFADAKEDLAQIRAKGKDDTNLAKALESEQTFLAYIKKQQDQLAGQIEKAMVAAKDAEAKLPEAIKAADAAKQANEKAMAATWLAMDAIGMNGILGSDKLDGKLAKYTVIRDATPRGLAEFSEKGQTNEKLIQELLSNEALMLQMLVADGPNSGKYGEATKIYTDIQKASPKAKEDIFQRLALAVSLSHAVPISKRVNNSKDGDEDETSNTTTDADISHFIDPVKRYLSYEKWYLDGELDKGFKDLSVWNLAMTVDASDPDEILAWGREALRNLRPDCIPNDGNTSDYVEVVDKEITYSSAGVVNDLPELAPMQNILANGGICGRRAFYGRFTLKSFGIPTVARKQPGHATLAHWHPDGWETKLGGGWGLGARGNYSAMNDTRSRPYGADVNFLASTQAREDATAFMRVKRAQWIGALVGEERKPGLITFSGKGGSSNTKKKGTEVVKPIFWNELALQEQRRIVTSLDSGKSASSNSAAVVASPLAATGTITVDAKGVITIPSAATSSPTESTSKATNHGVKDLVIFLKDLKSSETRLHLSRYSSETDTFEYTFDAPKAGKYKLTGDVVTPMPNQVLYASANGGADVKIELPYTVGLKKTIAPVEITLTNGKNVLKFHGPARVTIDQFILTPAN